MAAMMFAVQITGPTEMSSFNTVPFVPLLLGFACTIVTRLHWESAGKIARYGPHFSS